MDIVILSNFTEDFAGGDNDRFTYLASSLALEHDVEIVASDFSHHSKRPIATAPGNLPFKVTLVHEPGYPTNICLRRFFSHYAWGRNVGSYLKNRAAELFQLLGQRAAPNHAASGNAPSLAAIASMRSKNASITSAGMR